MCTLTQLVVALYGTYRLHATKPASSFSSSHS